MRVTCCGDGLDRRRPMRTPSRGWDCGEPLYCGCPKPYNCAPAVF